MLDKICKIVLLTTHRKAYMATVLKNQLLEDEHFRNFSHHIPGIENCCMKTIEYLLSIGIIQVSTAFEHALANAGGYSVVSEDSHDLSNGDDAKLSTARTCNKGRSYRAPISNVKGKTGFLRSQVFERKQKKFYYFVIPYSAYKNIPKTSNIEIPFELDGTPRRQRRGPMKYDNMWDYEVPDFVALATYTPVVIPEPIYCDLTESNTDETH